MKDLVNFWDSLNPWKTLAFFLFIIFLVSSFIWIKDKFIKFRNGILATFRDETLEPLRRELENLRGVINVLEPSVNQLSQKMNKGVSTR